MTVPENAPSPTVPPTLPAMDGQLVIHLVKVACCPGPPAADTEATPSDDASSPRTASETPIRASLRPRPEASRFAVISIPFVDTGEVPSSASPHPGVVATIAPIRPGAVLPA